MTHNLETKCTAQYEIILLLYIPLICYHGYVLCGYYPHVRQARVALLRILLKCHNEK